MQFTDLSAQYQRYKENINNRIQAVLEHGQYILGPEVGELESELARFTGVSHCIGVASGTDALQLSLMASVSKSIKLTFSKLILVNLMKLTTEDVI